MPAVQTRPVILTPDQCQAFARDGFLVVRGLIDLARIAAVRETFAARTEAIIRQLQGDGLVVDPQPGLPFETRLAQVAGELADRFGRGWRKDVASHAVYDLHQAPALLAALRELCQGRELLGMSVYNARPKLPGQALTVVPWHQDSGYFGPDTARSQIFTTWIPLVPVDAQNGCMQVARGSHRHGLVAHHTETGGGGFLEISGSGPDADLVETCVMQPGDVLLLHNLTWHRSLPNRSPTIRWSIDCRFVPLGEEAGADYTREFPDAWVLPGGSRPATPYATWRTWMEHVRW